MTTASDSPAKRGLDLQRMIALARPELGILSLATLSLFLSSGLGLVYPQAVSVMVDTVVEEADLSKLNWAVVVLLVLFALQAVFSLLRSWLFTVSGERVVARLRGDLYAAILGQDIGFFDTSRTGELTNRLASDTTVLQNTVTVNVSMALRYGVTGIGAFLLLMWMSPLLAAVAMSVVPIVAIAAALYGRTIRNLSVSVQDALAKATEVAEETFAGVRTVRSFAQEDAEAGRYQSAVQESFRLAARRALAAGAFVGAATFAGYGALALVVWWGGHLVIEGDMSMGDLTAFLLYTMMMAMSLGALAGLYGDFMKAVGASERVFELIDHAAPLEGSGGEDAESVRGDIRFIGVNFHYPARPDIQVLTDFSFELPAGGTVALVGPSGSGKSTVAALLSRFYDPDEGEISVDGRDIRQITPKSWRRHVGMVSQEPVLFATTIEENIRYARPDASHDEVVAAARAANAEDFVLSFPEGFDTAVGERGVRLSGGQKQRVAIARALLKDPAILVLDEATSALDAESEHLVQEALERLMEGRTTMIIAHRLSTVRAADQVMVLDQGRVVESGTHDELVSAKGLYHRLVERQFSDDEALSAK